MKTSFLFLLLLFCNTSTFLYARCNSYTGKMELAQKALDRNLDTKIGYQYQEAQPFGDTGYAKVKRYTEYFLVDTLGVEYPLATELSQLNNTITALDLRNQGFSELPDTVLKSTQLNLLFLSGNQLTSVPRQIGEVKNLQWLDLYSNQLTSLPAQIGKLSNLKVLALSRNQLTSLPGQIGELKNLQTLLLSGNQLASLPVQIGELKKLQMLALNKNQLTGLPKQIGELKKLQVLNLNKNQLTGLPEQIGELKILQVVELSGNQLTSLPEQIGTLKALQWLTLSYNQFTNLPNQIGELENLRVFSLDHNQLTSLPEQIGELKNLHTLDLSDNQLTSLPEQIRELKNLQWLTLFRNPMSSEYLDTMRAAMPWCTITWMPPVLKEEVLTKEALFEQNELDRIYWEGETASGEAHLKANPADTTFQMELANIYNSLAWSQLVTGQFAAAEASVTRGLQLNPTNSYLVTNLAPSLLLQGKTEVAMQVYEKWKDLPFGKTGLQLYRNVFLADFFEFEQVGIIPEERKAEVAAARKLLGGE